MFLYLLRRSYQDQNVLHVEDKLIFSKNSRITVMKETLTTLGQIFRCSYHPDIWCEGCRVNKLMQFQCTDTDIEIDEN